MKTVEEKLADEIVIAMKDTPGMCLIDLITRVTEFKYPTRKLSTDDPWYMKKKPAKWFMSNQSLLEAFEFYNRIRYRDKRAIGRTSD